MITNYFIPPHSQLSPYIDQYILSSSENAIVHFGGPWAASNETSLIFHLADKPASHANEHNGSNLTNKTTALVGLLTRYNGLVHFSGHYHTFIIQFKANGLNKIFAIPISICTDSIYAADEVFGNEMRQLYEQLLNAADLHALAHAADLYLLSFLRRRKEILYEDGISTITNELKRCTVVNSVTHYAAKANMSVRNFERRFSEQVGVSPKLFFKLFRFNQAVNTKIMQPGKSWTSIAHECNYYDLMHLIRDFKQFTNNSPKGFFQSYLSSGGTTDINQNSQVDSIQEEKFVHVRRKLA